MAPPYKVLQIWEKYFSNNTGMKKKKDLDLREDVNKSIISQILDLI